MENVVVEKESLSSSVSSSSVPFRSLNSRFLEEYLNLMKYIAVQEADDTEYIYRFLISKDEQEKETGLVVWKTFEEEQRERFSRTKVFANTVAVDQPVSILSDVYFRVSREIPFRTEYFLPGRMQNPRGSHSASNVLCSRAIVLDIDLHSDPSLLEQPALLSEFLRVGLEKLIEKYLVPSLAVFSGRGLHVYYAADACIPPEEHILLGKALASAISLPIFGVEPDLKAVGPHRLFRIPFSINLKSHTVSLPIPQYSSLQVYSLEDIAAMAGVLIDVNWIYNEQEKILHPVQGDVDTENIQLDEPALEKKLRAILPSVPEKEVESFVREQMNLFDHLGKPLYAEGQRQIFVLSLSGFLRQQGVPLHVARRIVAYIAKSTEDEEKEKRIAAVKDTYRKSLVEVGGKKIFFQFAKGQYNKVAWLRYTDWISRSVPAVWQAVAFLSVYLSQFSNWNELEDVKIFARKGRFAEDDILDSWLRRLFRRHRVRNLLLREGILVQGRDRGYTFTEDFLYKLRN